MLNDPLRIRGKPAPTPEERAQVMAFAEATGRPPKFCRSALLEANGDEAKARELIDDPQFIQMHMDFDLSGLMRAARDPMKFASEITRTQGHH